MASIYGDLGYKTILTKRTRDGGRDIIALSRRDYTDLKLIIECKRYALHRKVSVGQVRALYGVFQDSRPTKALLATTSTFTRSAQEFAKPHIWELGLLEHNDILQMIRDYAQREH
jgi:HJR/Mrr/RecB family endonuclease